MLESTWEAYATARKREYQPACGEWPNRSSPSVRWRRDEVDFLLSVVGREAGARTRLVAWPRGRLVGTFSVRAGTDPRSRAGIEDPYFVQSFAVTESREGLAGRVLDLPVRRALLGFHQREDVTLTYARGRLTLEWPGRESNDARIDEAERVIDELARRVDVVFLDRSRAAEVTAAAST